MTSGCCLFYLRADADARAVCAVPDADSGATSVLLSPRMRHDMPSPATATLEAWNTRTRPRLQLERPSPESTRHDCHVTAKISPGDPRASQSLTCGTAIKLKIVRRAAWRTGAGSSSARSCQSTRAHQGPELSTPSADARNQPPCLSKGAKCGARMRRLYLLGHVRARTPAANFARGGFTCVSVMRRAHHS